MIVATFILRSKTTNAGLIIFSNTAVDNVILSIYVKIRRCV